MSAETPRPPMGAVLLATCLCALSLAATAADTHSAPAVDDARTDHWFAAFVGRWSGEGRFNGRDAKFELAWSPVHQGAFVRFSARYVWQADGIEDSFTGEALYAAAKAGATPLRGDWFDSEGNRYATAAYVQPGTENRATVVVHWGETPLRGRSEYRLDAAGLEVTDSFLDGAEWRTFSQARLERM